MQGFSFSDLHWIDEMYQRYQQAPDSIDIEWRHFFAGWDLARSTVGADSSSIDLRIYNLIEAYRTYGHLVADFNPVRLSQIEQPPELELSSYGFSQNDLDAVFPTFGFLPESKAPLKTLIAALQKTYGARIGFEYKNIGNRELERWLEQQIETGLPFSISNEEKIEILQDLNRAEILETILHRRYVGQTRFSLEGAETMIPMLKHLLQASAEQGVVEAVIGMAHRGRLNVLANILNKTYSTVFYEFEDHYQFDESEGVGDVKYHQGATGTLMTATGQKIDVILAANPSHLESVNPVVEGIVRAKQEMIGNKNVLPILVHGDAALSGQGVIYETLQLSKLNGYQTGGSLHLVINNQIGYTTLPKDSRSTRYPTDIACSFGAPVFHVNAEKPEECVMAAKLAIAIRQKFHCDVFIDLNCYRKYGHNEGDEPNFTQPVLYQKIREKTPIRQLYSQKLMQEQIITSSLAETIEIQFTQELNQAIEEIPTGSPAGALPRESNHPFTVVETAVPAAKLQKLAFEFCTMPESLTLHPKVQKLLQERKEMMREDSSKPIIDWGMAEMLAYASLIVDAVHVRISGQDSRRGTFSHRHAVVVDMKSEHRYFPLSHLSEKKAPFDVFNSPLSELAVLGFEFGYSLTYPRSLVIWEAQYGDFANGAQIIIDQYITSGQQKWGKPCNLTLFLPHGYEGLGSEHSSAHLERFLELCADENMFVVNCSTPAQLFHLIRRQGLRAKSIPLIVMTPKKILRYQPTFSALNSFTNGEFVEFIDDDTIQAKPRRVLFCCGRVYYDLLKARKTLDVALFRIEQLYPFHMEKFTALTNKYKGCEWCWVQEEHRNMGAWSYIHPILEKVADASVRYIGRDLCASAAAGSFALHKKQLDQFVQEAFSS